MSLIEDFKRYQDKHGLTGLSSTGEAGRSSQNGALFTMEYVICLMADTNTSDEEKHAEIERLRGVYRSLEKFPGVSARIPNGKEFDSMDNVGAMATFSALYDNGEFARRCYEHGARTRATGIDQTQSADLSNKWYKLAWVLAGFRPPRFFWNNNTPNLFCFRGWHGRSPGHLAYLKMAAGLKVNLLESTIVMISQFLGAFKKSTDSDARKLPYVNWQFLKRRGFIWRWAYKLWCFMLMKRYENGMRDVYARYYGDDNHPIHTYSSKYEP